MEDSFINSPNGWLLKRTVFGLGVRRFCRFIDGQLYLFFSNIRVISKDQGCQYIETAIEIIPDTVINIKGDNRFVIRSSLTKDSIILEAESVDSMMSWVLALRARCFSSSSLSMACFKILSVIGRGYYGKVMLVEERETKELFAIKSIRKKMLLNQNAMKTVINEKKILSRLQHPFITSLKFAFQTSSKFYLGLEYVPGGELFQLIKKRGKLPIYEIKLFIAEIALALEYIHSIGIVYRDLKPENVLIGEDGFIKLTDFGLSKEFDLSVPNAMVGTPEYFAPEIIRKQPNGPEVDWWSLGILVYEFFFLRTPFNDKSPRRLFKMILEDEPNYPVYADNNTVDFISMLLEKDPYQRAGFYDIQTHVFMKGINFDDVMNKRVKPPYIPDITNIRKPSHFDNQFTNEKPVDSIVVPESGEDNINLSDFSTTGSMVHIDPSTFAGCDNIEEED